MSKGIWSYALFSAVCWLEFLVDSNLNTELFEHFPFVFSSTFEYQTCVLIPQQGSGEIWKFLAQQFLSYMHFYALCRICHLLTHANQWEFCDADGWRTFLEGSS
jgi:hypothetical protein